MNILEIKNIRKQFGEHIILDGVDFQVKEHCVYGFLGQNGAGKTTTMKIILGLLKADQGDVYVNGTKVNYGQTITNQYIGYLPDVPEFYGYMKPMEYLRLCGEITSMKSTLCKQRSKELLDMVGLTNANKKISGFSRGMKQRLGIAQALLNEPRLLICDEPTSALDPIGRKEILDILHQVKDKTTVLFSTHILTDVERICDTIALLHDGKIQLHGDLSQIKEKHKQRGIEVEFASMQDQQLFLSKAKELASICETKEESPMCIVLKGKTKDDLALQVMQILTTNQIVPIKYMRQEPTLEDLFMEVVKQ